MKLFKQIRELIRLKKYHYSVDLVNTRETTISENYYIKIIDNYTKNIISEYYIKYDFEVCKASLIVNHDEEEEFIDDEELNSLIFKFLLDINEVNQ